MLVIENGLKYWEVGNLDFPSIKNFRPVLFGSMGGNWWAWICGEKKVGEQYDSFLHGTCK